ncbi:DMT family transporter [Reyranella soli]|uniref:ABC transporter permease n=1 Tax=Reyranella soli TaxID=1230389 RepID=A0A512NMD6_9HYPH|nr:DMT family transporter [Reyranella soli]GEP60106.1 ABC transporter permease [Reyranella soli]
MTIRSTSNLHMTSTEWALLLFLSVLWGAGYLFGQIALAELSPFAIAFSRVALATMALLAVGLFAGQTFRLSWKVGALYLALGALGVLVPSILMLWSQVRIGAGLTSLLGATSPLFTVVIAHFLTRGEKMTPLRLGGMAVALVGVAIATRPVADGAGESILAELAVLAAAFCQAYAAVLARRCDASSPLELATGQLAGASLLSLPILLVVEGPRMLSRLSVETVLALLALALLTTALGYLIFFRLLVRAGATNVALISLLVPVTALFLAAVVLGEELSWSVFAGAVLILAGLVTFGAR